MSVRLQVPFGSTGKVCIHVFDSDGNPIDIGQYTLTFRLFRSMQDPDSAAIFIGTGSAITVFTPSNNGICEVEIPSTVISSMMIGRVYYWTMTLVSGASEPFIPVYGTFFAISPSQNE